MTDLLEFSPKAIIAMGIKRIQPLVEKHGITSPEVLAACKRWGGMLDEVNYPDSTCRWCGVAVTHAWKAPNNQMIDTRGGWYHTETKSKYCWEGAPAEAKPINRSDAEAELYAKQAEARLKPMGSTTGRMSQTNPDLKTIPGKHPVTKKPYVRKVSDNPQA